MMRAEKKNSSACAGEKTASQSLRVIAHTALRYAENFAATAVAACSRSTDPVLAA